MFSLSPTLMAILTRCGVVCSPWVMLLLTVVLAWHSAQLVWYVVYPAANAGVSTVANNQANTQQSTDISSLTLFSAANTASATPSVDISSLNLLLEGVFVNTAGMSAAIIRIQNKAQRYRQGQTIEGTNLQLTRVDWKSIELTDTNNAAKLQLKFGDTKPVPVPLASPLGADEPSNDGGQSAAALTDMQGIFNQGGSAFAGGRPFGGAQALAPQVNIALQNASKAFFENPQQLLTQSGVKAGSKGYEVVDVSSPYLKEIGLQVGDTVTSVNGKAVGPDLRQDQALFASLGAARQATIVVTRGSQTLTLNQKW